MSKYFKNFILCGEIDYYCILCEEPFEFQEQVEKHIRWEQHRKKIKNLPYIAKFKKDFIFKIGDKMYCEICNYVTNAASVSDHVKESKHAFRKSNPIDSINASDVIREKNGMVRYHSLTMSKFLWHGIVNNNCTLCTTPVQNTEHIKLLNHMVALVQSRMMLDEENKYIRKLNENVMYCFSCQQSFEKDATHNHIPDATKVLDSSKECAINETLFNKILTLKDEENDDLLTLLEKERKYFHIDLEKGKARCIQCKSSINNVKLSTLVSHRRAHKAENDESDSSDDTVVYSEIVDHGKRRAAIAQYGRRHYIKLNRGGSKGYCSLCDAHVSANLNLIKQHVRGTRHQGMLFARRLKKGLYFDNQMWHLPTEKPLHVYLRQILFADELKVACINNSLCVDLYSFYLILPMNDNKMKCLICNEVYKDTEIIKHTNSEAHMKKLISVSVMEIDYEKDFANEFIRKVEPDVYHCGYCNKLIPYWDQTQLHLKTGKHKYVKKSKEVVYRVAQEYFNKSSTFIGCKNSAALLKKLKNICSFSY